MPEKAESRASEGCTEITTSLARYAILAAACTSQVSAMLPGTKEVLLPHAPTSFFRGRDAVVESHCFSRNSVTVPTDSCRYRAGRSNSTESSSSLAQILM